MRLPRAIAGLGIGVCGACLLPSSRFVCEADEDCSSMAGGACEDGGQCSYPAEECASGRRYSKHAAAVGCAVSSEPPCLGEAGLGDDRTGTATGGGAESEDAASGSDTPGPSSSDGGDSGPPPDTCDGIDCSGAGRCVVVDGAATCDCDPGLHAVALQCLEDPCSAVQCRFVDAEDGDDAAEGTREAPWQTLARAREALGEARPGEHILFRRSRVWEGQLDVTGASGSLEAPIVIGAYGPLAEPKPRIEPGSVRISGSEHVVLRDLAIADDPTAEGAPNRPCVMVEDSQQVVIHDNELATCNTRAIRVSNGSAYTVVADNVIRDAGNKTAIFISDITWVDPVIPVGSHHWVIDNVVVGSGESTMDLVIRSGSGDLKVVGNLCTDAARYGIASITDGFSWVVNNTIARAAPPEATYGGGIYASEGTQYVAGNVVVESRSGIVARARADVLHNTIVAEADAFAGLQLEDVADGLEVRGNLVLGRESAPIVRAIGAVPGDFIAVLDDNAYAHAMAACQFWNASTLYDLAGWQALAGYDASSTCEIVPGLPGPAAGLDVDDWDAAFWDALAPDPSWPPCDDPPGALGCDRAPRPVELPAFDDFFEGDGRGWAGPLLVRQRYDVGP